MELATIDDIGKSIADAVKSYFTDRKKFEEQRKDLQPELKQVWDALENKQTVNGCTTKQDWAKFAGTSLRNLQYILKDGSRKRAKTDANPVRFANCDTADGIILGGVKYLIDRDHGGVMIGYSGVRWQKQFPHLRRLVGTLRVIEKPAPATDPVVAPKPTQGKKKQGAKFKGTRHDGHGAETQEYVNFKNEANRAKWLKKTRQAKGKTHVEIEEQTPAPRKPTPRCAYCGKTDFFSIADFNRHKNAHVVSHEEHWKRYNQEQIEKYGDGSEEQHPAAKELAAAVASADVPKTVAVFNERGQCVGVDDPCEPSEGE